MKCIEPKTTKFVSQSPEELNIFSLYVAHEDCTELCHLGLKWNF